jgi:hypothetical protein
VVLERLRQSVIGLLRRFQHHERLRLDQRILIGPADDSGRRPRVRRSARSAVSRGGPDICSVTAAFVPLMRIGKMEVQEMNHGLFTHSGWRGHKTYASSRAPH